MAGTSAESMRVDKFLTDFAISYGNAAQDYVANTVAPRIPVSQRSGKIRVWEKSEDFRIDEAFAPRRPTDVSSGIDIDMNTDTYACETYAMHALVPQDDVDDLNGEVDLEMEYTERLADRMLAQREKRLADLLTNNAIMTLGTTLSGANQWSHADSHPFASIEAGITAVYQACGVKPNQIIVPLDAAIKLRNHADYIDRYKSFKETVETLELAPTIMGLQVVIAKSQYNTAKRNTAKTLTLSTIWGKNVVLLYTPDAQTRKIGKSTLCTVKTLFVPGQTYVNKWFDNDRRATKIEQQECVQEKVTAATTGYLIKDVIA